MMRFTTRRRARKSASGCRIHSRRRAAVTVEFAVILPLLMLLFLGGLELSALNLARQTIGNAAYEAARKMIVPGGTIAQARQEAETQLGLAGIVSEITVKSSETPTVVTVTVSVPAQSISWGLTSFCFNYTMSQACSLTKE